jgi:hypothetical protein
MKENLGEIPIENASDAMHRTGFQNSSDAMHRTGFQKVITICVTTPGTEAKSCVVEDKIVWLAQKAYADSTKVVQGYIETVLSTVM